MIVVDASTIVAALVDAGVAGDEARDRIARARQRHAPQLVYVETANALRRLTSSALVTDDLASVAVGQLERLDVTAYPHAPFLRRVWELRKNLTAYDAIYIAVAEAVGAPLVTLDKRLASAPGIRCEVEVML